jgi:hypothetical protein
MRLQRYEKAGELPNIQPAFSRFLSAQAMNLGLFTSF